MRYGLADEDIAKRLEKSAVTAKDITVLNSTGKELAHLYVCSDISKSPKYTLPQMILLAKLFVKTITNPNDPLLLQLLAIVRKQKQDSGGHELTATKTLKKMRRIVYDEAAASQSQPVPRQSILSSSSSSASAADVITGSLPAANDFGVHFPLLCVRNAKPVVRVTYSGVCLFVFLLILFCIAVGYVFQRSYAYFGPGLLGEWRLLGPKHTPVHSGS